MITLEKKTGERAMRTGTDGRIQIGQAGCGYWGPNLLRNFRANGKCHLATVAEASAERRSFLNSRFSGLDVRRDWRDLVGDAELDALVVATPAATHFEIAQAALEAGKHVLVEKPLATTTGEVNE